MYESQVYSEPDYVAFLYRLRGRVGRNPNEPPVKAEVTYERDLVLLRKHREWGFNVPGEDIDFLEYDHEKAVAIFEYKKRSDWLYADVWRDDKRDASNLRALIDLGNRARLPVFLVFYPPSRNFFRVVSVNDCARQICLRIKTAD